MPVENKLLRFPLAAVKAAVEAWGGGDRVGVRISPTTTSPGETPLDSGVMKAVMSLPRIEPGLTAADGWIDCGKVATTSLW